MAAGISVPLPRLLMSPARKHILVEDRRGCLAGSGGDGDGIVDVVAGRAGAVAAGVLKAVPCPADPPERPEDAYCRAELGGDDLLHREMPAPAGCPQPLCLKQARGALAQGVIGQLVCTGQVSGYLPPAGCLGSPARERETARRRAARSL